MKVNPIIATPRLPLIKKWCAIVKSAPEDNKRIVLSKGKPQGLIATNPKGGQEVPNSIAGLRLMCKNAQKIETKNMISVSTNNRKPTVRPRLTTWVWQPR